MPKVVKPPTQIAGVIGIEAKPIVMNEAPVDRIDWRALAELPPFQMFAVEKAKKSPDNVMGWMAEFLNTNIQAVGDEAFFQEYSQWHAAKGYWPNECPLGRLINGD